MLLSSQVFYNSLMFRLDRFSVFSLTANESLLYFFLNGDVVKSHVDVSAPGVKERQYLSLLLGNLCAAFSIHPHQSSVRQERAQTKEEKFGHWSLKGHYVVFGE